MSTPSGNANSPPSSTDEVVVPSGTPGQRLRAQQWPSIYSQSEGIQVPMEAEVVHVGDPAIAANLAFVRAPGRLMTHAKDLLDFQVERWLERQDKHFLEGAE